MANRTDPLAKQVHGLNPQGLMSRIIRRKIYGCNFWKEHCFAVSTEAVIEPCVALSYVGGTYGGKRQPAPFLCVVLKLLQLQPEDEIILEFIKQERFKYLRAIGAFYFRLVGQARDVYVHLEPLLADYRKLRLRLEDGKFKIVCMDEFIDDMLKKTAMVDVDLPVLPKRETLEEEGLLPPTRLSALEHDVEVYAGNAAAAAAGGAGVDGKRVVVFASEREQQLWLLQKQQLQQQQKTLQRHVQKQRMRLLQQQHEQQLLEQVRELELEYDYHETTSQMKTEGKGKTDAPFAGSGKMRRPKIEEEGEGWWREGTRPQHRHRQQPTRGGEGGSGAAPNHTASRYYHQGGTRAAGAGGRGAQGGSRSPTPVMHRTAAEAEGPAASTYGGSHRAIIHFGGDKNYREYDEQRRSAGTAGSEYEEGSASGAAWREGAGESQRQKSGQGSRRTGRDKRRGKEDTYGPREDEEEDEEAHATNKEYRERGLRRLGAGEEADEGRVHRRRQPEETTRNRRRREHDEMSAPEEGGAEGERRGAKKKRRKSNDTDAETANLNGVVEKEQAKSEEKKGSPSYKAKARHAAASIKGGREAEAGLSQEDEGPQSRRGDGRHRQEERQQQHRELKENGTEEEQQHGLDGRKDVERTTGEGGGGRNGRRSREEEGRGGEERGRGGRGYAETERAGEEEGETGDSQRRSKRRDTGTHEGGTGGRALKEKTCEEERNRDTRRHRRGEEGASVTAGIREELRRTKYVPRHEEESEEAKEKGSRDAGENKQIRSAVAERESGSGAEMEERETRHRRGERGCDYEEEKGGRRRGEAERHRKRRSLSNEEGKVGRRGSFRDSEERESRRQRDRRDNRQERDAERRNSDKRAKEVDRDSKRFDKRYRRSTPSCSPERRTKDAPRSSCRAVAGSSGAETTAKEQGPSRLFEHPCSPSSKKKGGATGNGKGRDKQVSVQEWNTLRVELGLKPLK